MKRLMRFGIMAGVFLPLLLPAAAEVRLPRVFSDHMVLQRGVELPVWGWADKGEKVVVELAGRRAEAVADAAGCWSARLAPLPAGGPHTLTIAGAATTTTIHDVLVGEVWVASGQSWMTWDVARVDDAAAEIKAADYPHIRMFTVPQTEALTPEADCGGAWAVCAPTTVRSFSGCGYFFARRLHQVLRVPVGILHASVPGTGLWAWTSRDVHQDDSALRKRLEAFDTAIKGFGKKFHDKYGASIRTWLDAKAAAKAGEKVPYPPEIWVYRRPSAEWEQWLAAADAAIAAGQTVALPPDVQPYPTGDPRNSSRLPSTVLFNGMIQPLIPYACMGFIWWQGGSEGPEAYRTLFPAMIRDWRKKWGRGELPFLFVQRPNLNEQVSGGGPKLPEFREAQAAALALPKTGMAVALDIGLPDDLHPTNMQEAGRRLALLAEQMAYGRDVVSSGPTFARATVEGKKLRLHFTNIGGGLTARGGGALLGFEVAGMDGKHVAADAVIDGQTILVSSAQVAEPVAVRYAWAANPTCNLYNTDGLPAAPFRKSISPP
jgi:sialate O-acetylesterase